MLRRTLNVSVFFLSLMFFQTCAGDEKETSDEELRQILVSHSRHARSLSLQSKE